MKTQRPDWKDYELQILKVFREEYPERIVLGNISIVGQHSEKKRQLDVVIYGENDKKIDSVIECKNLSRTITLPVLDSFFGKLHDLGIKKGIIITTKGFSDGTKKYAKKKNIELRKIDYEYLKDYYYIPPCEIPDIFNKTTKYDTPYCSQCDITSLYEIGKVSGMAEWESLYCPKCKTQLDEVRSDANHRIIKIFRGKNINTNEVDEVITKHINITREEWMSFPFLMDLPYEENECCFICKHEFCEFPPTHSKIEYKGKNICSECFMSRRTLLIDYKYI
jgi:restriction endonuclease